MQRLSTSMMDSRLRTPAPRRKGWADGKRKNNWGLNLAKMKRLESTWREMHRMKRAKNQRSENQLRDPKENLKVKRSNSKHLRQDSSPERRRGWGVKRILLSDIYNPKTQNSFLLDSTTANNQGGSYGRSRLWYQLVTPNMRYYPKETRRSHQG